jgi:predicted RNase H-like HicB family nuclease
MTRYLTIIEKTIEKTDTGYSAYSSDLAGCVSTGATYEEVLLLSTYTEVAA